MVSGLIIKNEPVILFCQSLYCLCTSLCTGYWPHRPHRVIIGTKRGSKNILVRSARRNISFCRMSGGKIENTKFLHQRLQIFCIFIFLPNHESEGFLSAALLGNKLPCLDKKAASFQRVHLPGAWMKCSPCARFRRNILIYSCCGDSLSYAPTSVAR